MAGGLEVLLRATVASPIGNHAQWLQERIAGRYAGAWLDDQSIEQVLNASEMIGWRLNTASRCGRPVWLVQPGSQAFLPDFDIYKEGPDSVRWAFDEIRRKSTATDVQTGPKAIYGVIYEWLDRRSRLNSQGPIKTIVREHILDHDLHCR